MDDAAPPDWKRSYTPVERERIWPQLLGIDLNEPEPAETGRVSPETLRQIKKDVDRSLFFVPKKERFELRHNLTSIIVSLLSENKNYHYYQGYHEVTAVFLYVCGYTRCKKIMRKLSQEIFYPYLTEKNFNTALNQLDEMLHLIELADPEFGEYLRNVFGETPLLFALPWSLTLFAHSVNRIEYLCRLYDFILPRRGTLLPAMAAAALRGHTHVMGAHLTFEEIHSFFSKPFGKETTSSSQTLSENEEKEIEEVINTTYKIEKLREKRNKKESFGTRVLNILPIIATVGASLLELYLSAQ